MFAVASSSKSSVGKIRGWADFYQGDWVAGI
jgi:hypothetical protein